MIIFQFFFQIVKKKNWEIKILFFRNPADDGVVSRCQQVVIVIN